jgi:hypothetical protein
LLTGTLKAEKVVVVVVVVVVLLQRHNILVTTATNIINAITINNRNQFYER